MPTVCQCHSGPHLPSLLFTHRPPVKGGPGETTTCLAPGLVKDLEPEFYPRCLGLSFNLRVFSCYLQHTRSPARADSDDTGVACGTREAKAVAFLFGNIHVSSSLMILERGSEIITVLCAHPAGTPQFPEIKSHPLAR